MNPLIIANLRRSFKEKFGRPCRLTDKQVWECFESGYLCPDAEEAYMVLMNHYPVSVL